MKLWPFGKTVTTLKLSEDEAKAIGAHYRRVERTFLTLRDPDVVRVFREVVKQNTGITISVFSEADWPGHARVEFQTEAYVPSGMAPGKTGYSKSKHTFLVVKDPKVVAACLEVLEAGGPINFYVYGLSEGYPDSRVEFYTHAYEPYPTVVKETLTEPDDE